MCENKKFYITTPIYYPSDNLHIGHAYTTVAADTLTRYKKIMGYDTYFLTGTDEHGQKIELRAKEAGLTPIQFVDGIVDNIKKLWKTMDIEYDDFIRTSEHRHVVAVQKIFKQLYEQGDIYKGEYEGWYCTPCESFFTELQLVDGKCPDCGREVQKTKEESYFLKLSKYQDWLIDYINDHPEFIQPTSRKNEMINNFLKPGLEDLCVSRTSIKWGIPVDFDPKHTVYVWVDALTNYINALGYGSDDTSKFEKYWPADLQLVGKEIIRFHTIIWPIILHAIGLPIPKQVFGHGWLVLNGGKMSKSLGNVIDPVVLCNRYGSDAIRYYLNRAIPFGSDGQFTYESLLTLMNADLSNNLGNLVSRTVAMIEKYFDGEVLAPSEYNDIDKELINKALALPVNVEKHVEQLQLPVALEDIWSLIGDCNKYIDVTEPWILGKDESGKERLRTVLYVLAECIRFVAVLIAPAMPNTPVKIYEQLGIEDDNLKTWDSLKEFGLLQPGSKVKKGEALFPRIDVKKELEQMEPENKEEKPATVKKESSANVAKQIFNEISIDDFAKVKLTVAKVLECEKVKKSDKLLKLTVEIGNETRTIVSGIAQFYAPENLVGKKIVVVANLKPVKLKGIESQGMLLTASCVDESTKVEKLSLIEVPDFIESGAEIR